MKNSKVAVSWSPEDSSDIYEKTELFGDILAEYCPELIWINCKNAKDLRAKQMVREADLLIRDRIGEVLASCVDEEL